MLKSLEIKNIAIIEKASVEFSRGLNILTGETGAGKSILIDSINAVTGEKTSRELIRTGEEAAEVNAFFENISDEVKSRLEENGLPAEDDGTLLLYRKLTRDGKNTCRINGAPVTVSMLKNIGMNLINIHGQRDSQALLDSERHIDFLDGFAKTENELEAFADDFERLQNVKNEIRSLSLDSAYKERQTELLSYQIKELTDAEIVIGEREALTKKKNVLNNSKKLCEALNSSLIALTGDGDSFGAEGLINGAVSSVSSVMSLAKGLDSLVEGLNTANSYIEECASMIDDVLRQLEDMDGNIEAIEERLDLLYRLSKKYGETEEEMLNFLENAKAELDGITTSDERLVELYIIRDALLVSCRQKAEILSEKRRLAALTVSESVQKELSFLDMPRCRFVVNIIPCEMNEKGIDSVEFLISANPGEEPKALGKVASGGELSRIMLAMKNVLHKTGGADTLIFDEIDSGVSGSAAGKIAVKLYGVSKNSQVLCITHLAQIAAFADSHKHIYKQVSDEKTYTSIRELSSEERPSELVRMTYGQSSDDVHLESAKKMIFSAKEQKNTL